MIDTAKNGVGAYDSVDFVESFTDRGNLAGYAVEAYDQEKGVNTVLGTVGPNYLLVKNSELCEVVEDALYDEHWSATVPKRVFWDGSRFASIYSLGRSTETYSSMDADGNERELSLSVLVRNSYNGSWKAEVRLMALDMFCMNGMVVGKEFGAVNFRHSQNNSDWGNVLKTELNPLIHSAANGSFKELATKINALHNAEVTDNNLELLFGKSSRVNFGPTTVGTIMRRYLDEECRNMHGLFSAGTNVLWHNDDKSFSSNSFALNERWVKAFNDLPL